MARRLGIVLQTAGRVSSVKQLASSRSIYMPPPPISRFQPQEGYAERAKQFYEFEEVTKDVFKTSNLSSSRQGSHKAAYGGLIFSQAMAAAENTVSSDLKPHAIHSFFILNVDTSIPVEYTVRRSRDGKSFCTRSVEAIQNEKVAFTMEISFHKIEPDAVVHQAEMPKVPHWSELACTREAVPWIKEKVEKENIELPKSVQWSLYQYDSRASGQGDLFEIRPTDIYKHYGLSSDTSTKTFYHWFRAVGDLPTDEKLHRYLVAYNTDSVMAASVYRPHYVHKDFCPTMMFSLDHNIWIHEHDLKADQWLLYAVESTWAGKSRGFTKGQLYTEDGRLVLSATQECLVRSRGSVSRL